jgi:hypothetical protein
MDGEGGEAAIMPASLIRRFEVTIVPDRRKPPKKVREIKAQGDICALRSLSGLFVDS